MYRSKEIQRAKDMKNDFKYHFNNGEEVTIYKRDIETLEWLVEQAERTEAYKAALTSISKGEVSPAFYAKSTLFEVDQWLEFRKNRQIKS